MVSFDDLFNKARDVANLAGKKTGEVVEVSKLKLKAVQLNADIQKAYEKLGSIVYEQEKTDGNAAELIALCVSEIDLLFTEFNDINDKIAETKSTIKCHNCGAINSDEAIYCSRCGTTLIIPYTNKTENEDTVYTQSETVDMDFEDADKKSEEPKSL